MNEFSDHIQILIWFMIGITIAFVICFSAFFEYHNIWASLIIALALIIIVIAVLARCGSEI